MIVVDFLIGLMIIGIGTLMLKFNFQLTNMFSRNNVFERRLGSGSTYLVMQVLAVLIILYGMLLSFSLHDNFLDWLLSPLRNLLS